MLNKLCQVFPIAQCAPKCVNAPSVARLQIIRVLSLSLISAAWIPFVSANELITLKNGFELEAISHEEKDAVLQVVLVRGLIQLALDDIATIRSIPITASPAPLGNTSKTTAEEIEAALRLASKAQGLPAELVIAVATVESGLRANAVSPKGARGLMQLMPRTQQMLRVSDDTVIQNALGGARYLRKLLLQYDCDAVKALAAYNSGPGNVSRFRGVPPFPETQQYLRRVLKEYARLLNAGAHRAAN